MRGFDNRVGLRCCAGNISEELRKNVLNDGPFVHVETTTVHEHRSDGWLDLRAKGTGGFPGEPHRCARHQHTCFALILGWLRPSS